MVKLERARRWFIAGRRLSLCYAPWFSSQELLQFLSKLFLLCLENQVRLYYISLHLRYEDSEGQQEEEAYHPQTGSSFKVEHQSNAEGKGQKRGHLDDSPSPDASHIKTASVV